MRTTALGTESPVDLAAFRRLALPPPSKEECACALGARGELDPSHMGGCTAL